MPQESRKQNTIKPTTTRSTDNSIGRMANKSSANDPSFASNNVVAINNKKNKNQSRKKLVAQYAVAGLTGGVGKMVDKATKQSVSRAAERAVAIYKKKQAKKNRSGAVNIEKPAKKLTGPVFYIMLGLAATKDIMDLFVAPTIIFSFFTSFLGIFVSFVILFYLIYNGVKWNTRKVVTFTITTIIEFIPILNAFFPGEMVNLILIRFFENSDRLKEYADKKASLLQKI